MPTAQLRGHTGERDQAASAVSGAPKTRRRTLSGFRMLLVVTLLAMVPAALATSSASADSSCSADVCVVGSAVSTVSTPLGLVTVTIGSTNVATVQLAASLPNTVVVGIPFAYPPGPPTLPGYTRRTVNTTVGVINIDTVVFPPGPPTRLAIPGLALVSIHPPGPCRAHTTGTTVTFTPLAQVFPPGPPT
jgi:hypothetical protein